MDSYDNRIFRFLGLLVSLVVFVLLVLAANAAETMRVAQFMIVLALASLFAPLFVFAFLQRGQYGTHRASKQEPIAYGLVSFAAAYWALFVFGNGDNPPMFLFCSLCSMIFAIMAVAKIGPKPKEKRSSLAISPKPRSRTGAMAIHPRLLELPRAIYRWLVAAYCLAFILALGLIIVGYGPTLKLMVADLLVLVIFGLSHLIYRRGHWTPPQT
jgi:hypothetical protein